MGDDEAVPLRRGRRRGAGKSFVASFLGQGIGGVAKVLAGVVVARLLGPEGFGGYSLALALTVGIFTIAGLSASSGATYVVARGPDKEERAWSVLLLGWAIALAMSVIGALIVWLLRGLLPADVDDSLLVIAVASSGAYLVVNMATGVVLGTGRYPSYNALSAGYYVVSGAASVVGALTIGTALGAVSCWAISTLVWGLASTVYVRTLVTSAHRETVVGQWRPVMRFGLPSHVSNVITFANYRLDLFLVGILVGTAGAGEYAAVVAVAEILWFMSVTASTVLFNEVARRDDPAAARVLSERVARLVLWSTFGASVLVAVFASPLLEVLYGSAYGGSAGSLRALLVGVVALSLSRVLANHVAASGAPARNIVGSVLALAISLALDLMLIPRFGVLGAAISSSVAYSAALAHRLLVFDRMRPEGVDGGLGYLWLRRADILLLREILGEVRGSVRLR